MKKIFFRIWILTFLIMSATACATPKQVTLVVMVHDSFAVSEKCHPGI